MKKELLGDLITTQKGYAFKSQDYTLSGTGIIRVSDFTDNSICLDNIVYIDNALASNYQQYRLNTDDIIIQTVGSWPTNPQSVVGKVIKVSQKAANCLLNQNAVKIVPNNNINNKYLYYLLKSKEFFNFIISSARGAASQASITLDDIRKYEFVLPSTTVQIKIANVLSNFDALIENNATRIKILEEMTQKIYKEWFVDFKFPGYETATFNDNNLGKILKIPKGKNITKSTIQKGNIPVVAAGLTPAYYHNQYNTVAPVITISASGANAGYVNIYYQNIWASDCSYIDKNITDYVYYYYLLLKNNQFEISKMQRGAAQPHVYPEDLGRLIVPDIAEKIIQKFENIIIPFFEEIKILSLKNETLKQTRDILLPRLISGEIDVENLEVK